MAPISSGLWKLRCCPTALPHSLWGAWFVKRLPGRAGRRPQGQAQKHGPYPLSFFTWMPQGPGQVLPHSGSWGPTDPPPALVGPRVGSAVERWKTCSKGLPSPLPTPHSWEECWSGAQACAGFSVTFLDSGIGLPTPILTVYVRLFPPMPGRGLWTPHHPCPGAHHLSTTSPHLSSSPPSVSFGFEFKAQMQPQLCSPQKKKKFRDLP